MFLFEPKFRFPLLLGGFFLTLSIAIILGFTYFKLKQIISEPLPSLLRTPPEPEKLSQMAKEEAEQLREEAVRMPAKATKVEEKCLWVPLEQDVKTGIYKWGPVMLGPRQKKEGFYDFFYDAKLENFGEKTINNCSYYQLTLFKRGNFVLNIPKGLIQIGAYSKLAPEFLANHKGNKFDLRIQYFSEKGEDFSSVKFIEWEIEHLKVN